MLDRHLRQLCFDREFGHQMRFIAGPRQCGKTTMVKRFLKRMDQAPHYYNWDNREVRSAYQSKNKWYAPAVLANEGADTRWVVFDEIHKYPKWKDILKDHYDTYHEQITYLVTGSARLDLFRKSGDALSGRYFLFRLYPLTLGEVASSWSPIEDDTRDAIAFIQKRLSRSGAHQGAVEQLLIFSGFPDPFISQSKKFQHKWQLDYIDSLLSDDISQISQVQELENVAHLIQLLPERIGSPLSLNSLKQDMLCSYNAIRHYVHVLELSYMVFSLSPYAKSIARAITKEKKFYFYDWTKAATEGAVFENYVAVELMAMTQLWADNGCPSSVHYIRTKDGKETDFLIQRDGRPWLLAEAKLTPRSIASHHYKQAEALGGIPILQIVQAPDVAEKYDNAYQVSASRLF